MQVSVIIPAFNLRNFIVRAVDSVRAQTFGDWELIVIDDASTDGTGDFVEALAQEDPRIRLIRLVENGGPSAARNRGIEAARGKWIAILDGDDAWRPERLDRMVRVGAETGSDFVGDDLILFDEGLQREIGVYFGLTEAVTRLDADFMFSQDNPMRIGMIQPIIRRDFLREAGLRYDETLRSFEDFLLYAEMMFKGARAVLIREAYYICTPRRGPISRKKATGSRSTSSAEALLRIIATLKDRYAGQVTPQISRGLARCRRLATQRWVAGEITRLRRAGSVLKLMEFVLRHPVGAVRYVIAAPRWQREPTSSLSAGTRLES